MRAYTVQRRSAPPPAESRDPVQRLAGGGGGGGGGGGESARYGADLAKIMAPQGGRPLAGSIRAKMERAFQADFSKVRLHNGPEAGALDAFAATRGNHIFFPEGDHDLNSRSGTERLAHELAHVRQQATGRVRAMGGLSVDPDPQLEAEAQAIGRSVVANGGTGGVATGMDAARHGGTPGPVQGAPNLVLRTAAFSTRATTRRERKARKNATSRSSSSRKT
jgi:hypothetical protein